MSQKKIEFLYSNLSSTIDGVTVTPKKTNIEEQIYNIL